MMAQDQQQPGMPVSSDELHAYADGCLPAERLAVVEAHLAAHLEATRQVADYRAINRALSDIETGVLSEPVPAGLIAAARQPRSGRVPLAAAAAACLLLGFAGGWSANRLPTSGGDALERLAQQTGTAYAVYAPEQRHPIEVRANQSQHLSAWLSNRLGMSLTIPSLGDLGLGFVGGRLMTSETGPAALLMYEKADGRRLVLYISNEGPFGHGHQLRYRHMAGTGVVFWSQGQTGFGLAGGFSEAELLPAAESVRAQLRR